jgi:hypothetical protein
LQSVGDHGPRAIEKGIRVPAGETVIRQVDQHIRRNGWNPFWTFALAPSKEGADAMISGLTVHRQAPNLGHAPVARMSPDFVRLAVSITMPPQPTGSAKTLSAAAVDRLADAALHYRTTAEGSFESAPLKTDDGFLFSASLANLKGRWLEYYFTAADKSGRVTRLPEASANRAFRCRLTSDTKSPVIEHQPVKAWKAGQPLPIEAKISDPDGVAVARVYFRKLDETLPYECITLEKRGGKFVGTIPGEAIPADFDFVYYLEAVDEGGSGCFFPDWEKTAPYIIVTTER